MHINDLSPKEIKQFHRALGRSVGCTYVNSGPLAWYARGLLDRVTFDALQYVPQSLIELRPCAVWRIVLLPYDIGTDEISPKSQVYTAVHEALHTVRIRRFPGGTVKWYAEYFNPHDRAFCTLEEASASESEADVRFWAEGTVRQPSFDGYWLRDFSQLAQDAYAHRIKQLKHSGRGKAFDKVSKAAIRILEGMGVEPR
jgi:hypothetical protein